MLGRLLYTTSEHTFIEKLTDNSCISRDCVYICCSAPALFIHHRLFASTFTAGAIPKDTQQLVSKAVAIEIVEPAGDSHPEDALEADYQCVDSDVNKYANEPAV
jgi:hypothetical protein